MRSFPSQADVVCFPVVEFWGGAEKIRLDVTPWKWRLSVNKPHITHGIPKAFRKYDENNELYAVPGTDGCDYIDRESGSLIPHASFYSQDAHNLRLHALTGEKEAFEMLPGLV